jgi:hypothetical protein
MASIDELKRLIDLHDLADRLGIKKGKGGEKANYHSPHSADKNPSLSIFPPLPDRGTGWKDHSANKGGSCIDLVIHVQGCDVAEAMRYLHDAYNIPRDRIDAPAEQRPKTAVDYIGERAIENREKARAYLTGRGITDAAIDRALKCKTLGFNDWTSPKKPAGEVGHGGPAAVFLVRDLNGAQLVAVDMRYLDPAINGGVKTQTQGEKDGFGWTADPRKLRDAERVVVVESAINALSIDSCEMPRTAAYAIRGVGNVHNIDFSFLRDKQVVICMDNDDVIADGPRKGERPGPDAACALYERLTALNIAAILVDQGEWVRDLADGATKKTESINDANDYLQLRGADELRKAINKYEEWIIAGLPGEAKAHRGPARVWLPEQDFRQYWRYRTRLDFLSYLAKAGDGEEEKPTHVDVAGFRVASLSRVSVASAAATMTGDPDNAPTPYFAVTVQTPRHGANLTRAVLQDKQVHNLAVWQQFGPIWEPKRFSRMLSILERTAHLGARSAANFVGLAWRDGRLVVNEGPDCYFTNAEQQCPYSDLTFTSGPVSDAARVLTKYQETFKQNAASMALVWGLGGHLKALLGFWPHMMMQADKSAGKSTLIKAIERTIGFTMFSGQSLQTEFRLLTSISHTSHPVGWEELSARKQDVIDKAVALLQENYQYTITKRGSEMTEYVLSAPVLLAGEDVPVKSLHGKLCRTNLTGKKGPMLPRDLPRFPVRQWLQYLADLDRSAVLDKYDELRAYCLSKSCASADDEGGKRMASNYAAMLLAWGYLCDFAGMPTNAGNFGADLVAEMNRHISETTAERSPWVWILESALSEIDAGNFKHPFKFDDVEGEDCLLVRPAHIMDHISGSTGLREKWNQLPVKTPAVFRKQLVAAGVTVGEKEIERTIFMKRVAHLTPLSLKRLSSYGLSVGRRLDHVHENA